MPTFILTWNPEKHYKIPDAEYSDKVVDTETGTFVERWSTGGRKTGIAPGDRVFLLRQGRHERGIVASGHFTDAIVFEAEHFDDPTDAANYAEVEWDNWLPPGLRIPYETLTAEVSTVDWRNMRQGGVEVHDPTAQDVLEMLWDRRLLQAGRLASVPDVEDPTANGLLADFRPKSADEYTAHLAGRTLTKGRHHEKLVKEFGEHAISCGFKVATPHPRDLTLRKNDVEWLVEAKIVYRGNATDAVRAAIGQLLTYRHFLYPDLPSPRLMGLFSEPVGHAYGELLESLDICAVWPCGGYWCGTPSVAATGLAADPKTSAHQRAPQSTDATRRKEAARPEPR